MKHPHVSTRLALVFILSCLFFTTIPAAAKRNAPKPVPSVVANDIEYSAPHAFIGFVLAVDISSRNELWRQRIYQVNTDPVLEHDVQEVFITSLVIEGGTLIIKNESNETYYLDLATRQITKSH